MPTKIEALTAASRLHDYGVNFSHDCTEADALYATLREYINSMPDPLDYFAANLQADDRLVKCIRAMDDSALELFALHPDAEREEHITEVELTNWLALPSEVAKVTQRLALEARAIARVRYMQADAMLAEKQRREDK